MLFLSLDGQQVLIDAKLSRAIGVAKQYFNKKLLCET
jgi:hypothetical protein